MAKSQPPAAPEPPSFETALQRLEQLVEEMDSRNIPLQDLIARYEEGTKLVKVCEDRLKEAAQRIEIITRTASGQPQIEEFSPDAKAKATPASDAPEVSLF